MGKRTHTQTHTHTHELTHLLILPLRFLPRGFVVEQVRVKIAWDEQSCHRWWRLLWPQSTRPM